MSTTLSGAKVAVLVSNGFCENDMTETQRALQAASASCKIVSLDQGLVNSWHGQGWGHHFAVDNPLSSALAADYGMLVLPGGRRSIDKLMLTAHTRRFIGGFMTAGKPVAVCGRALQLMIFSEQLSGVSVTGPETVRDEASRSGAIWQDAPYVIDRNLLTGKTEDNRAGFIEAMITHFATMNAAAAHAA